MTSIAKLKIWRGDSADAGRWEHYEVPFEPGQSVLDALRWIRTTRDPSLAIRFSCINANACKECMIELDGTTVYACTARLAAREMTLTPLSNKRLVRDLVTEIGPPAERVVPRRLSHPFAEESGTRAARKNDLTDPRTEPYSPPSLRGLKMFQTRKEHMSVQHSPTAFGDLRGWIEWFAAHAALQEIAATGVWTL